MVSFWALIKDVFNNGFHRESNLRSNYIPSAFGKRSFAPDSVKSLSLAALM